MAITVEQQVLEKFKDKATNVKSLPNRLFIDLPREYVKEAVQTIFNELGARYQISVGTDARPLHGNFEILHFFAFDKSNFRVALRFKVPPDDPKIDSITSIIPGANWAEREFRDFIGVEPVGHPDPRRLVLPDDWPEGVHPLRKEVPYNYQPPATTGCEFKFKEPPPGATALPIGPFFPVLEEPIQFRLFVEGENVVGADHRGFYVHRGIEKLGESQLTYNQIPFLAERICGICGFTHSVCYCETVEGAAGIEVPLPAKYVRSYCLEMERVHSHLLWLGLACHILGFDTLFMQFWRIREPIMWMAERITGNRKNYGMNLVGGTRRNIPEEIREELLRVIDQTEKETLELSKTLLNDSAFIARTKEVGILTPEEVRLTGALGPTARASGVDIDVRRDFPYAAYPYLKFDVIVLNGCDVLSRALVRVYETIESLKMMRQILKEFPDGPTMVKIEEELPPYREFMSATESPRGEDFHYVMLGENNRPYRWKVRAPSYMNIPSVFWMFKPGTTIADAPITIGSVDPCISCTERFEIVDRSTGESKFLSQKEMYEISRRGGRK
jgi:Ni,Fe-hydrogenase III large subunit/Ni,Fe-hydrogenase III component G